MKDLLFVWFPFCVRLSIILGFSLKFACLSALYSSYSLLY